jgi:Ion channel
MENEPPKFDGVNTRDLRLPQAIAYCANCNRWAPVNLKLTGYRFDCPKWDLNTIHVAAVIGDRWSHAAWVRCIARLELYQAYRGRLRVLGYLIMALVVLGLLLSLLPWPLARRASALIGLVLVVDIVLFTSANALSSQRPRFPPRSIIRAIWGFGQLVVGFALIHAGLESLFKVGDKIAALDFCRALYFSVVTLATVGYGDITPPLDPWQAAFWTVVLQILCGLYYLGVFVATTVSWVRGIQRPLTLEELLAESQKLDQQDLQLLDATNSETAR